MHMDVIKETRLTHNFCDCWKCLLVELYNYKFEGDFVVVKSICNKKTYSYLPLTNYTDLTLTQAIELRSTLSPMDDYQIRVLNSEYQGFRESDTVTMRLDVEKTNHEILWKERLDQKCRNKIRQAQKKKIIVRKGRYRKIIDDFYSLYTVAMHDHGTPSLQKKYFFLIGELFNAKYFVAYKGKTPVSGTVVIRDNDLCMALFGASNRAYLSYRPNNFIYWEAIKDSISENIKIFDFGRSGYDSSTYNFKKHFGAIPVKIDILKPQKSDIYLKYKTASNLWQKLPRMITNNLGPKLSRYLCDL